VIRDLCAELGVKCAVSRHVAEGGAGALALAEAVTRTPTFPPEVRFSYDLESDPLT
jgi:formate--tetrahydrofolate ligase